MKRTITVLQDDIDKGIQESSNHCAVARAVNRDLFDMLVEGPVFQDERVSVDGEAIRLFGHCLADDMCISWITHVGNLPHEALEFITGFDEGEPVEPFKFEVELEIPTPPPPSGE